MVKGGNHLTQSSRGYAEIPCHFQVTEYLLITTEQIENGSRSSSLRKQLSKELEPQPNILNLHIVLAVDGQICDEGLQLAIRAATQDD